MGADVALLEDVDYQRAEAGVDDLLGGTVQTETAVRIGGPIVN